MPIDHGGELVFIPGDPPRRGAFALFDPAPRGAAGRVTSVELVKYGHRSARRALTVARVVPVAEALAWLASRAANAQAPDSTAAWTVAVKAGVNLVARGRLLPAISPGGFDAWQVGPLDRDDEDFLHALAAAFPPAAHALPLASGPPLRVRSPESLIRDCWDAIEGR